jgi:hypothetical protein
MNTALVAEAERWQVAPPKEEHCPDNVRAELQISCNGHVRDRTDWMVSSGVLSLDEPDGLRFAVRGPRPPPTTPKVPPGALSPPMRFLPTPAAAPRPSAALDLPQQPQ